MAIIEQAFGEHGEKHPVSAASAVYDALRKKVVSLDHPPGTVLSRTAIAQEYGVSLTPVREALQRLEEDGLVRIMPQSGTVVKRIDVDQLRETQFLRVAVETEVVRRLALDPDPEVISRARAILNMQEALQGDTAQMGLFNELDRAFHRTLFAGVGMTNLQQILIRRLGHLFRCQMLDLPSEGKMADIVEKHWSILQWIEQGDPDAAMEAIRVHLSGTIRRLDMLREKYPEFFSS
ncbi:GntR family transcriptional regulator [Sagittula stellata]|uniref:Transcriptional regulatory protein n=1 Tax=Sagittula stellata (strain ATCC 700073 / DSM 11524 / E-37) TaxID=388399 RepID=A3K8S3_SAGS3|nr:GntR family transcriptional regulator [Sagittula stellata]EBA06511.1 transcriptional regulatory protein [Sagittula stellata E-37]